MKTIIFNTAKIIVTAGLLFFILTRIGLETLTNTIQSFSAWQIIFLLASILLNCIISAINIDIFLRGLNRKIPLIKLAHYSLTAWAIGLFAPGKIGEFSILHYLKKRKVPLGEGFAVTLLDKLITAGALLTLSIAGLCIFFPHSTLIPIIISAALFAILTAYLLLTNTGRNIIKKYILKKHAEKLTGFFIAFTKLLRKPHLIIINTALTYLKWIINAVAFYIVLESLGQHIEWYWIVAIFSTTVLISLIPISVSGLGVKEGAAYALFSLPIFSIDAQVTTAVFLLLTILNYAIALCALFFAPKE